jgi:hypothetical protein
VKKKQRVLQTLKLFFPKGVLVFFFSVTAIGAAPFVVYSLILILGSSETPFAQPPQLPLSVSQGFFLVIFPANLAFSLVSFFLSRLGMSKLFVQQTSLVET